MTKRITADHVKLKRAYEPAAADDGTRILIDRLWPRGVWKAFQQATQDDLRIDGIRIFRLFPPKKRARPLSLPRGGS